MPRGIPANRTYFQEVSHTCERCGKEKTKKPNGSWRCSPCQSAAIRAGKLRKLSGTSAPLAPPVVPVPAPPPPPVSFTLPASPSGRVHIPKDATVLIQWLAEDGKPCCADLSLADLAASIGRSVLRAWQATAPPVERIARACQDFEDRTTEVRLTEQGQQSLKEAAETPEPAPEAKPKPVPELVVKPLPGAPKINWNDVQLRATLSVALGTERLTKEGAIAIVHGKKDGHFTAKRCIAVDGFDTVVMVLKNIGSSGDPIWTAEAGPNEPKRLVWEDGTTDTYPEG